MWFHGHIDLPYSQEFMRFMWLHFGANPENSRKYLYEKKLKLAYFNHKNSINR